MRLDSITQLAGLTRRRDYARTSLSFLRRHLSTRRNAKLYDSADSAVEVVKSGDTILGGGFGLCGLPNTLFGAMAKRTDVRNLTGVSNNAGAGGRPVGMGLLLETGQLSKLIASYIGRWVFILSTCYPPLSHSNKTLESMYLKGKIDLELTPQGTLCERIRAAGAGIPAFYTPTGFNTPVQFGDVPMRNDENGKVTS